MLCSVWLDKNELFTVFQCSVSSSSPFSVLDIFASHSAKVPVAVQVTQSVGSGCDLKVELTRFADHRWGVRRRKGSRLASRILVDETNSGVAVC